MSEATCDTHRARASLARQRWRGPGVLIASVCLIAPAGGCANYSDRVLQADRDSTHIRTFNGVASVTIAGFKFLYSESIKDGYATGTADFQENARRVPGGAASIVIETLTGVTAVGFADSDLDFSPAAPIAVGALLAKIDGYLDLREAFGFGHEALPRVRLRIVPRDLASGMKSLQVSRLTEDIELRLMIVSPVGSEDIDAWAAKWISVMAHELNHLRGFEHSRMFPNVVSDETAAYLIQTCVRWQLTRRELEDPLAEFEELRALSTQFGLLPMSAAARKLDHLPPTLAGRVLARLMTWRITGDFPVAFDDPRRDRLMEQCHENSLRAIDVYTAL